MKDTVNFIHTLSIVSRASDFPRQKKQPFYGSLHFVWDNPGEPVPEETFTRSHLSWSSIVPYLLHPSTTIHGILPVQSTYLRILFHNLSPSFLWSTSWLGTLHFILHTFLHPIIVFASCFALVPRLCHLILVSLSTLYLELYIVATSLMPHIHLTILISAC